MAMKILVTGDLQNFDQLQSVIPERHILTAVPAHEFQSEQAGNYNLIIDMDLDENPERLVLYSGLSNRPVLACAVTRSLAEIVSLACVDPKCTLLGMNLMQGFLDRPHAEVSLFREKDSDSLDNLMNLMGLPYTLVSDRAGMVSPRVLAMIINEASFLLQEKGATHKGIDTAMLLGVNYPKGPLEWADQIGIGKVVAILNAVRRETGDERYKVSPLLYRMSLTGEKFYF